MSSSPNKLIAFGFAAIGAGYIWELIRGDNTSNATQGLGDGRMAARLGRAPTQNSLPPSPTSKNDVLQLKDGVRTIKFYPVGDIDSRVRFITDQIRRDSKNPKIVTEARTLLTGRCPTVKGGVKWCVAPKDWRGEINQLFYAVTNPNSPSAVRYTRDHANVDFFASSELMQRLPGEDCDGMAIRLGALLRAVGYPVKCRVVAPAGHPDEWAHIYLLVGSVPGEGNNPPQWIPLDPTEPHPPGWEVPSHLISTKRDFLV